MKSKEFFYSVIVVLAAALPTFAQTSWDVLGNWEFEYWAQDTSFILPLQFTGENFTSGSITGTDSQGNPVSGQITGSTILIGDESKYATSGTIAGAGYWYVTLNGSINPDGSIGWGYTGPNPPSSWGQEPGAFGNSVAYGTIGWTGPFGTVSGQAEAVAIPEANTGSGAALLTLGILSISLLRQRKP
jgi:hypothetical protein